MEQFEEKRSVARYPIPTLFDLEIQHQSYRFEFSINVSEKGAYMETDRLLPVGTRAILRFALPNLDWVFEIHSQIQWVKEITPDERLDGKKDGMGFSFLSMDEADQEKITTYMKNFKLEDLEL